MILLKNKITLGIYLLIASFFLSLNISCTEKIAGSEVTNEDAVCLVGKVLDQRGQGVSNIIARLDKIQLADTTDNNGNYSLKLSKQEISNLKINLDTLSDTVKIISSGNVASSINITKWIDTLPSVYLIQRNIYGQLNTDGTSLKRIEAIIAVLDTNSNVIEEFSKELWFNTGTSGFSGFIYFPKNTGSQKYSVYVRVFNKDSINSGKSETIYFNDLAGDIEIPLFNTNFNPELQVFAGNDTALSINDTLQLSANATGNSSSIVKKWEWNINGNGFKQTASGDTTIIFPDSETIILCIVKVTDTLGNTALDSITIDCKKDIPIIHLEVPSNVLTNTKVTIKASAVDLGKINKWEWNLSNVSYVHSDSNNVSYVTFKAPSTPTNILCSLKITDDDGNIGYDTCTIPVVAAPPPVILFEIPRNISFNTNVIVKATVADSGKILKWEWNIDSINYVQSDSNNSSCIAFTSPSTYTNIHCNLKVTDEDGNTGYDSCIIPLGVWVVDNGLSISSPISLFDNHFYTIKCNSTESGSIIQLQIYDGTSWVDSGAPYVLNISAGVVKRIDLKISNTGQIYSVFSINDSLYTFKYSNNAFTMIGKLPPGSNLTCSSISQDGTFYIATTQENHIKLYQWTNAIWTVIPTESFESGDISSIALETINNEVFFGGTISNIKHFLYKYNGTITTTIDLGQYNAFHSFMMYSCNNDLYICGDYRTAETSGIYYYLQKYDGSTCQHITPKVSSIGLTRSTEIKDFSVYDNEYFFVIHDSYMNHNTDYIDRYYKNELKPVGNDIDGPSTEDSITRFFIDSDNQLYAFKGDKAYRLQ
jgi:hypothetical protein